MIEGTFAGKPIALYDADKKLCIGIFDTPTTCAKYVFPEQNSHIATKIVCNYLKNKSCRGTKNNRIGVKLAFRLASVEQAKLLIDEAAILLAEGYPIIRFNIAQRFHSTRISLAEAHTRKINRA